MGIGRSENMRRIRSKDTKPEMIVRSMVHKLGFRFRLHRRDLPGCPDLVFPSRRKVIFVHGCFWHGHTCPEVARTPKTNTEYWVQKIRGNIERDNRNQEKLKALGWRILVVWECETKIETKLARRICRFLK